MQFKKPIRFVGLAALFLIPFFALIAMPFWPFDFTNSFFFPFITGKAFYFRILVEIAFAAWLILCLYEPSYRPRKTPLTVAVTVFALVALVADLLGVNPVRSLWSNFERMEGWIVIIHLWAFYMAASGFFGHGEGAKRLWHRWLNTELVAAIAVSIYGILQLVGVAAIHQGSTRIDASLGNAAYFAVYLLWNIGIALYLFMENRARRASGTGSAFFAWAYPILAAIFAFLLFETATRGTILGLAGGVLLALLVYAIFGRGASRHSRWISAGIVAILLVLGVSFWAGRNAPFIQHNDVLSRIASISLSNTESTARLYIWGEAFQGFAERPILGWGQEDFNYIFNAHYNPQLWNQEQWFDRAHSVYLDWLTASGIVGLIAYLALYVVLLAALWRSSLSVGTKSILTGLVAGYAVHNLFVFDNLASYVLFFAAMAFMDSLRPAGQFRIFGMRPLSAEGIEYVGAPIVIVALVAVLYVFNVRPIQANTRLITALESCASQSPDPALFQGALSVGTYVADQEIREQTLSCVQSVVARADVPTPTKQAYFALAASAIQDQIAATPLKDARIYTLGGNFLASIGDTADAVALLQTASTLSPHKPSLDIAYATALMNTGSADEAVSVLAADYALVPIDTQLATAYAVALVVDGKEAQARSTFASTTGLFDSEAMAQAYAVAKQYQKSIAIYRALVTASPTDVNLSVALARTQLLAGDKYGSAATLRALEKSHPEYASQIEATIKAAGL